ncbi:MAG TPA: CE1759 family FMN reductase [Acidimicrobiia bacterium]|nr:CE1759 family FMN reductase [Acidimicrobiia bacterium]
MSARRLVVVTAGLGQPSTSRMLADRLATAAARAITHREEDVEIEIVELRDHARAITNRMLAGSGSPELEAILGSLGGADGLIAVTPVFSASYSGLFKMFFDVVEPGALTGMPVLMGATAGTPRHSLVLEHALRPLFSYLGTMPVRTAVFASSQDWAESGDANGLAGRIERAATELAAAVTGDTTRTAPNALDDLVPLDQLLGEDR